MSIDRLDLEGLRMCAVDGMIRHWQYSVKEKCHWLAHLSWSVGRCSRQCALSQIVPSTKYCIIQLTVFTTFLQTRHHTQTSVLRSLHSHNVTGCCHLRRAH